MMQHAIFSNGHSSYLVGKVNWTSIPFQAKKSFNIPSKRYLHTSIIYQGNLYILGGIDNETDFKDNRMYCLELETMKWTIIEGKNFNESRNSHSCTLFKNQIYFFGGSQQQSNPTNDFFKFNVVQTTWIQIQCEQPVPPERELAIFTSINDQYIFLYGGIDILQDKIFDDAYLFKNKKWAKINIFNNPSERIRMGIALCGRRIFMFGGQGPSQESSALFDNFYELIIHQFDLELTFKEILCKGNKPQKRTAHGMVGISSRYFLVYGGEGTVLEENDNTESCILNDIWVYDLEEMQWTQIQTIGGPLIPRYQFSLSLYNNQIFIFGGMNEEHIVIDDFTRLQFMEYNQQDPQICQKCQRQYKQRQELVTTDYLQPSLSSGFYYNLAMEISFPFRAIQMIVEIAEEVASQTIKMYSAKTIEQFDYMCFQFDGKKKLSPSCFLNMIQDSNNTFEANILYNLKIASFRLGKTFLYIQVDDSQRKVFLMSADNRYAPNYEEMFIHYAYVEKLNNLNIYYGKSYGDKQAIYNILKSQVEDPYCLLSRTSGNFLNIFQLNILPTVQKAYYYELIFYYEPHCDIKIYHNQKKSQLLETLGYNITSLPDFSFKNYLKYSKLKRKIKAYLNNDDNCLLPQNYLQYLKKQKNQGIIQQLSLGKLSSKLVQKCVVFRCIEDKYLQNNQGILIYCGNWLIDRYDSKLGQLISDKFYKKKYKKRQNIFNYVGVVYLSSSLNLNQSKTKVQNKFKYNQIIQELITKIKNTKNDDNLEQDKFDQLYERLILNRQNNKKLKRQL